MTKAEFDDYSQSYSADIEKVIGVFGQKHDFFIQAKAEILLPLLSSLSGDLSHLRVLDVGCGVGLLHPYLTGKIGRLDGVDISAASLEVARKDNPAVHYQIHDGQSLPYSDAAFDCAMAVTVMHHVPPQDWMVFLNELRRVVRPGGLVVIIEHNPLNPLTQWVVRTAPMDKNAKLVTAWRLQRLMAEAGLKHRWAAYFLLAPFRGRFFRALEHVVRKVPLGTQYIAAGRV